MKNICSICCENFNNSNHSKIICPYNVCNFSACKTCVRNYLLSTNKDPHCMNCFNAWDDEFTINSINKTFYQKKYKNYRKKLLLDIEISKLPDTMIAAEKEKQIIYEKEKMKILQSQILEVQKQLKILNTNKLKIFNNIVNIQHGIGSSSDEKNRKFIMPCRNNNCRGFLSSQYKCDLCEMFTCPHCLELIGFNKNDPHTCNPEDVATAEMIKKDTKPCPKCGVRIHKIQGCDQMYCTQCKVAFSYKTLKIDTGQVHNPHFYEEQKLLNNGQVIRNPQDVLCGGLCNYPQLNRNILSRVRNFNITDKTTRDNLQLNLLTISHIHRVINQITNYDLPRKREMLRNISNTEKLRVYYILGKKNEKSYDKNDLAKDVFNNDVKRRKETKILHIFELLSVFGIEMFNSILNFAHSLEFINFIIDKIKQIDNLRKFCNNEFCKISNTYCCSLIYINDKWQISNKKYKLNEFKELH